MAYEVLGHTADISLRVEGRDLPELFEAAVLGMTEIMEPEANESVEGVSREIEVESIDRTALLIDFMNEVLFLAERNREFYFEVKFSEIRNTYLKAELKGKRAKLFHRDIKAVTYHGAEIKKNEAGGLETEIIFDI